jgi:hypothetical protein
MDLMYHANSIVKHKKWKFKLVFGLILRYSLFQN